MNIVDIICLRIVLGIPNYLNTSFFSGRILVIIIFLASSYMHTCCITPKAYHSCLSNPSVYLQTFYEVLFSISIYIYFKRSIFTNFLFILLFNFYMTAFKMNIFFASPPPPELSVTPQSFSARTIFRNLRKGASHPHNIGSMLGKSSRLVFIKAKN